MRFIVPTGRRGEREHWDPYEHVASLPCDGCGGAPGFILRAQSLLAGGRGYGVCETCLSRILADPERRIWFGDENRAYEYESLTEREVIEFD